MNNHPIAVDTNQHRVRVISRRWGMQTNLELFHVLNELWKRSAALKGDPPFAYSYQTDELMVSPDWLLELPS